MGELTNGYILRHKPFFIVILGKYEWTSVYESTSIRMNVALLGG